MTLKQVGQESLKDTTSPVVSNLQWLWKFQRIQIGIEL